MLSGRTFGEAEALNGAPVTIVSEGAARLLWPGEDPLGQRLSLDRDETERVVVGVVGDVQENAYNVLGPQPAVYVPIGPVEGRGSFLAAAYAVIRGTPPADVVTAIVVEAVPGATVDVVDIGERMDMVMDREQFQSGLLGGLAVLAIVLAAVGVYAVLAHTVARQTRELGVRIAFGARRAAIVAHVVRRTFVPSAIGLGLAIAYGFRQVLVEYLFRINPDESATYLLALGLVSAALVAASVVPAYRAASIDPVIALRNE